MAYLKQRTNTWFAVWYDNGKKIVRSTGVKVGKAAEKRLAQSTADAMEAAAKKTSAVDAALDAVRASAEMLGHRSYMPSIKEYLENYKAGGKPSSVSNYKRAKDRLLEYLGATAALPLDKLKPSHCTDFLREELNRVSFGTVEYYLSMLRAAFNSAVRDDLIRKNPFSAIPLRKIGNPDATKRLPFTAEEMHTIMTKFPTHWREVVMTSFLTGGQRLGDVCTLKWESINKKRNIITFRTGKTGKELLVPITPQLKALFDSKPQSDEYVFPEMAAKYQRRSTLSAQFTSLLKAYGIIEDSVKKLPGSRRNISKKSFHSIRHTVVSMLRSSMLFSADIAREIVGHDSEAIERAYFTASEEIKMQGLLYLAEQTKKQRSGC